jgi:hypothetical protein
MIFLEGMVREDEDKKTRESSKLVFFPPKLPFLDVYLKKISTITLWCVVIPLDPQLIYT